MPYDEIDTSSRGYFRGTQLASLGQRWRAGLVDYVPPVVIVLIFQGWLGWLSAFAWLLGSNVMCQGIYGQSFGKFFLRLTTFVAMVDFQGNERLAAPGIKRCLYRQALLCVIDLPVLCLGLFRPLWEPWRRCWSDSITNTFVAAGRPGQLNLQQMFGEVEEFRKREKPER